MKPLALAERTPLRVIKPTASPPKVKYWPSALVGSYTTPPFPPYTPCIVTFTFLSNIFITRKREGRREGENERIKDFGDSDRSTIGANI